MTEEVKPEIIKKTQDSLRKHIKKPPLTEKLLKKPPFRFLHDIVTNIIRETGFLNGLFTSEELNHENIKDRDGKIAFLDKLISAVKIITGIPLSVRATKIVAGHEPTKTNELLQAIGLALDKKLDSKDVAQQLRKKGNKKSDPSDSKKASPRETSQEQNGASKPKIQNEVPNLQEQSRDKKKHSSSPPKSMKEQVRQEDLAEQKKNSSSTSKQQKHKESNKTSKSKRDGNRDSKAAAAKKSELAPTQSQDEAELPPNSIGDGNPSGPGILEADQKRPQSAVGQRRLSEARQQSDEQSDQQLQRTKAVEMSPASSQDSPRYQEAKVLQPSTTESTNQVANQDQKIQASTKGPVLQASSPPSKPQSQHPSTPQAPVPVPLVRPRTAARVGSARPGAPRVRSRGDVAVVTEDVAKPAPVNLIVEDDNTITNNEDEDENLVTVETAPVEDVNEKRQSSASAVSRPTSQQGHLVAQILETQKELEVGTSSQDNGEVLPHHTEIEWEAGKKRERDTALKEVERMRSLIQTLTRAAHPLGKLLDSLQEDVDNMQRELTQWQNMQTDLEKQLHLEETLSSQASQPLKDQLKQLQQAVRSQLSQLSSAKANIINNDERIHRLLSGAQSH